MKELLISLLNFLGFAWWVEIVTESPRCTYYFGPFLTDQEAQLEQGGYIEDLTQEGAQCVGVSVKRCKPLKLTIYDEGGEMREPTGIPLFSSQS